MKKINCILLIDDDENDNHFHKINIMEAGVCNHIQIAMNGVEALEYIKKSGDPNQSESFPKPDIMFLDINMPRMNGFEFLDEYHKLDEKLKSKAMILMLTTSLNPDDRKKSMSYKEVTGFENKPLSVEGVIEIVEKYF